MYIQIGCMVLTDVFSKSSFPLRLFITLQSQISLYTNAEFYLSVYLSICLSVCLSVCLSASLSVCLSVYLSIYQWLYSPFLGPCLFFSFNLFYTDVRTPWTGDKPVARPLPTHRTTQTQNKCTRTYMPRVRFEPTIPVFEWTKTVHALDRAVTVIGLTQNYNSEKSLSNYFCGNECHVMQCMTFDRSVFVTYIKMIPRFITQWIFRFE
jgi:hypothetical protein